MKKISPIKSKKCVTYDQKSFCLDENDENDENENDEKGNDEKIRKYQKVKDHCHYIGKFRGAAHSICNLRYKVPKNIPIVIHNGSIYDYHFIINQSAEEFNGEFDGIEENTEKYITFSVPIKKIIKKSVIIVEQLKQLHTS